MKLKLKWKCAKGEFDTKTVQMVDIPARSILDEFDAEICISDGYNLSIAEIHLGDLESSNALAKELVRRWNEFPEELKQ